MADADKDPFPGLLLSDPSSSSSEDGKENNTPYKISEVGCEGKNHHRNGQPLSELPNHKPPPKQTRPVLPSPSFPSKSQNHQDRNDAFVVRKRVRFSPTAIHGKGRSYPPSMTVKGVRFAQDLSPGEASSCNPSNLKVLEQIVSPMKESIVTRHSARSASGELPAMQATDDSPQPMSMPPQDESKQHPSGRFSRFPWLDTCYFIDENYPPRPQYRLNHHETTRLNPLYDTTSDVASNESFIAYYGNDQPQDRVATSGTVISQVKKESPSRSRMHPKTQTDSTHPKKTVHPSTRHYPSPILVIRNKNNPKKPNQRRPVFVLRNKPKTDANAQSAGAGSVPLKDLKPLRNSRIYNLTPVVDNVKEPLRYGSTANVTWWDV